MNEQTIVVIDDEPSISEVVNAYLQRAGYRVLVAADGQTALSILEKDNPDLVVLDLMLPHVDGLEIIRHLRAKGDTPIIILTARRGETDRILGLEMGADDYVVKPFSPRELVSRVRAVLRRVHSSELANDEEALTYEGLQIERSTRIVKVDGEKRSLTSKEFDLLWLLARHPRQVFDRTTLLDSVWGLADYIDPSTVTVHVHRLREKIEMDQARPRYIQTVWGVGYKFEP